VRFRISGLAYSLNKEEPTKSRPALRLVTNDYIQKSSFNPFPMGVYKTTFENTPVTWKIGRTATDDHCAMCSMDIGDYEMDILHVEIFRDQTSMERMLNKFASRLGLADPVQSGYELALAYAMQNSDSFGQEPEKKGSNEYWSAEKTVMKTEKLGGLQEL
jgi:hypothetical protein